MPCPYNPQVLSGLIVEGQSKLQMEVNIALNSERVFLVEEMPAPKK